MNSQLLRPFCPGVRIGNWNEDIALEEDLLKDFLGKRERGELLCQKAGNILGTVNAKIELSVSRDGNVHFGDTVMLINPGNKDRSRPPYSLCMTIPEDAMHDFKTALCAETQLVTASKCVPTPILRGAFVIRSCEGSHNGEVLRYGQPFYLSTADGRLYLHSDRVTFINAAKKSRHCNVTLVSTPSHLTEWNIFPFHPKSRMELEYSAVQANSRIIFNHIKTNRNLNLEDFDLRTPFGVEKEVSCWTCVDSHKAETDTNHWMITMSIPGDSIMPVQFVADQPCQPPC